MSRSRNYERRRRRRDWSAWKARWREYRDDVRTGMVRTRVPKLNRWRLFKAKRQRALMAWNAADSRGRQIYETPPLPGSVGDGDGRQLRAWHKVFVEVSVTVDGCGRSVVETGRIVGVDR